MSLGANVTLGASVGSAAGLVTGRAGLTVGSGTVGVVGVGAGGLAGLSGAQFSRTCWISSSSCTSLSVRGCNGSSHLSWPWRGLGWWLPLLLSQWWSGLAFRHGGETIALCP